MTSTLELTQAIEIRNSLWEEDPRIPKWVDIKSTSLDQFFTKDAVAKKCLDDLNSYLAQDGIELGSVTYLEPSAGAGAFLNLLPPSRRIGLDIMPQNEEIRQADFLSWEPDPSDLPVIVIGNPPFGYRAWLALEFMNHAAKFADYVGFILPMSFQSDGKGSPKNRVKGMHLVKTEILPPDSFVTPDGKVLKINALWQIWKRGELPTEPQATCNNWVDLFTVDQRKERLCGQERIEEANYFLQRTFYSDVPKLVKSFSEVKYVCGYGIVIKRDYKKIVELLERTDWAKYSNLAAHNCRHISMYHIRKVITDAGFIDD